jgi:hypothetical protein
MRIEWLGRSDSRGRSRKNYDPLSCSPELWRNGFRNSFRRAWRRGARRTADRGRARHVNGVTIRELRSKADPAADDPRGRAPGQEGDPATLHPAEQAARLRHHPLGSRASRTVIELLEQARAITHEYVYGRPARFRFEPAALTNDGDFAA